MRVEITDEAEADIVAGYWFYERQATGLGDYFRDAIITDIDSLTFYGGVHEVVFGFHRLLAKRFPYVIYYDLADEVVRVVAVLDARQDPDRTAHRLASP